MANYEGRRICTLKVSNFDILAFCSLDAVSKNKAVWHNYGIYNYILWVLKKREEQRLEAAQMKFLRHLLSITKLDKEKNQCIREKTGAQNILQEIKQYQK